MTTLLEMPPRKIRSDKGKTPKRPSKPLQVYLPPALRAALEKFVSEQRFQTSLTDVAEVAIQEFLAREKYWPAKPVDALVVVPRDGR